LQEFTRLLTAPAIGPADFSATTALPLMPARRQRQGGGKEDAGGQRAGAAA
jgi:hypothetical protein